MSLERRLLNDIARPESHRCGPAAFIDAERWENNLPSGKISLGLPLAGVSITLYSARPPQASNYREMPTLVHPEYLWPSPQEGQGASLEIAPFEHDGSATVPPPGAGRRYVCIYESKQLELVALDQNPRRVSCLLLPISASGGNLNQGLYVGDSCKLLLDRATSWAAEASGADAHAADGEVVFTGAVLGCPGFPFARFTGRRSVPATARGMLGQQDAAHLEGAAWQREVLVCGELEGLQGRCWECSRCLRVHGPRTASSLDALGLVVCVSCEHASSVHASPGPPRTGRPQTQPAAAAMTTAASASAASPPVCVLTVYSGCIVAVVRQNLRHDDLVYAGGSDAWCVVSIDCRDRTAWTCSHGACLASLHARGSKPTCKHLECLCKHVRQRVSSLDSLRSPAGEDLDAAGRELLPNELDVDFDGIVSSSPQDSQNAVLGSHAAVALCLDGFMAFCGDVIHLPRRCPLATCVNTGAGASSTVRRLLTYD